MAQNFEVGDFLANSCGRPHGYAWGVFNTTASYNPLALKQGAGWIIAQLDQDLCGDNREAGSGVKNDGKEKRRCAVRRLKQKIYDRAWGGRIIRYPGHGKSTPVSRGKLPVK